MRNRHLKTILTTLCVLAPLAFATGAHADPTGTLSFSGQLASGATPTPGSAQSFTVSGVLSDPEYLWVYVDPTGQGCADDPADEAVLPVTAIAAGIPLNSGYYSLNYSYVPELQSNSYSLCGYADDASTDADPVASNELDFQTAGPSATVNISGPILAGGAAAPMPQQPASPTVSGSTTTPAYLWVYADPNAYPCADDPAEEAAGSAVATIRSAVPLSTGNFTFTYSYVPTLPDNSYSLCAYVDDTATDATPYGEVEQDFTTGQPQGALSLSAASAPIAGLQDSFQLTGTTPVSAYLWSFVDPSGSGCADSPLDEINTPGVTALTNQLSLMPGPISYSYSYTPTVGGQDYTLCSYIDDTAADTTPYAAVEYDFTAATPTATLTASAVGKPYKDRSFTVNLAGSAQVSERLWVYLDSTGDGCADDPQDEQTQTSRSPLIAGQQMPAGAFSASVTLTPGQGATTYDLCAYLDDSAADATPLAQVDYQFTPKVAPKPAPHLSKLTANSKLTPTRVTVALTAVADATARVIVTSGRKRHTLSIKFGSSGHATLKLPAAWASGKRGRVLHVTVTARDSYGNSKTLRLIERLPN